MPSSIVPSLADELGVSEERARSLLQTLVRELRAQAQDDEVHLSELGTFQDEEGHLSFEPADALARLVNQRYEGLDPQSVHSPARSTSPSKETILSPVLAKEPPKRPLDPFLVQAVEQPPDLPVEVWASFDTEAKKGRASASDASPDEPDDGKTESDRAPATGSTRSSVSARRDRATGPRVAAGILVVLLLAGAAWFLLGRQGLVPPPNAPFGGANDPAPSAQETQPATPLPDSPSAAADSPSTAQASPQPTPTTQEPSDTAARPDTSGTSDASESEEWTLVVASQAERAPAEALAEAYRDRFSDPSFSVTVLPGETENMTRYRVAVGTFDSSDAALEAMEQHQSQLPDGVWLLRLQ